MKFGSAQFVVLSELVILLLLESNIMSKVLAVSTLAFNPATTTGTTGKTP